MYTIYLYLLITYIEFNKNCHIFFIAFGGDITCDFESNESFAGHCNWQYSFLSRNTLEWYIDSDHSRPKWENGK